MTTIRYRRELPEAEFASLSAEQIREYVLDEAFALVEHALTHWGMAARGELEGPLDRFERRLEREKAAYAWLGRATVAEWDTMLGASWRTRDAQITMEITKDKLLQG